MKAHPRARSPRFLVLALLLVLPLAAARAQTVINSLPYTITSPGDYVLGGNLSYNATSGSAITFAVGNVTLDFNGHFISGLGAGKATQATGLYGNNRANITVQNGSIVGFFYGIYFNGSDPSSSAANNTGNVIQNMRLPSNTYTGISLNNPVTCRVENCQVNKTGGTTVYGASSYTFGIYVSNGSATIKNNQVSIVTGVGGHYGSGINCVSSTSHFVRGNEVDSCSLGVRMDGNAGLYQNNLVANYTIAFSGGVDAGGNHT